MLNKSYSTLRRIRITCTEDQWKEAMEWLWNNGYNLQEQGPLISRQSLTQRRNKEGELLYYMVAHKKVQPPKSKTCASGLITKKPYSNVL